MERGPGLRAWALLRPVGCAAHDGSGILPSPRRVTAMDSMAESPNPPEKIEALERRLAADPGSVLFFSLAEAYRQAGRLVAAERVLREGLRQHGGHHSARTALGRILAGSGRTDEAREQLQEVLRGAPGNLLARNLLEELPRREARGDGTRSVAVPEASGDVVGSAAPAPPPGVTDAESDQEPMPSPVDDLSSVTLAELYLRQGDRERAIEIYRDVAAREPENPEWRERLRALTAPREAADRRTGPAPEQYRSQGATRNAAVASEPQVAGSAPARDGRKAARVAALGRYLTRVRRARGPGAR